MLLDAFVFNSIRQVGQKLLIELQALGVQMLGNVTTSIMSARLYNCTAQLRNVTQLFLIDETSCWLIQVSDLLTPSSLS